MVNAARLVDGVPEEADNGIILSRKLGTDLTVEVYVTKSIITNAMSPG